MADGTIGIDETNLDKLLDTEVLTVNAQTVHRERIRLAGALDTDLVKVQDEALNVSLDIPKVVGLTAGSALALAAGSNVNIDGSTLPAGITGKLMQVDISGSLAAKWEIVKRDGGVEVTVSVLYTSGLAGKASEIWKPPNKDYGQQAGDGVDTNFRVKVTNLDDNRTADFYATMYWDEV